MRMWRLIVWGAMICILIICSFGLIQASRAENKISRSNANGEFEKQPTAIVQQITLEGNKITKDRIILKELTFHPFDTIPVSLLAAEAEQSRYNLLNTSLFNFVYITYNITLDKKVHFVVKVEERWYLWAFPLLEQSDRNMSSFLKNGNWDMMNYGLYIRRDNFRGRQEVVRFRARAGYSTQFSLSFQSPEFRNKFGWGFLVDYNAYDHAPLSTIDDQPVYFKSIGHTIWQSVQNQLYLQYRPQLYNHHQLALSHFDHTIADTVRKLNPDFFGNNRRELHFFELAYTFTHDTRDSRIFPLKGSLIMITLTKTGFGLQKNDLNYYSTQGRFFNFQQLSKRFYCGSQLTGFASTLSQTPYFKNEGIGYRDFVSGYEYYVMDGTSYLLCKNQLLFELLPTQVKQLEFIPFHKFSKIHYAIYLRTFFDAGYVNNPKIVGSNRMVNTINYGYGAGFDLVTFYDKAFSFYYAFNKLGEHGLYVHFYLKI